jgi:hypothetical protein
MAAKRRIISRLETRICTTQQRIEDLTNCPKHRLPSHANACPCQGELYWELDRLDESIYRLTTLEHSTFRWLLWYVWSSTNTPWFPGESTRSWSQTSHSIAAWQKYGVGQRNGDAACSDRRAFIYYQNSRKVSGRPAAAMSTQ